MDENKFPLKEKNGTRISDWSKKIGQSQEELMILALCFQNPLCQIHNAAVEVFFASEAWGRKFIRQWKKTLFNAV
jgi:hypothetical protein